MAKDNKKSDNELFSFEVKTTKEVEEISKTTNEQGEEVTVTKKIKKEVPVRVMILRPTRRQSEAADIEFARKQSEYIKMGILTRAMITKKYADSGGVLTEEEASSLIQKHMELNKARTDFVEITTKFHNKTELTEEEKAQLSEVAERIDTIRTFIAEVESQYSTLFEHTADVKASNHVILWYALNLTHLVENEGTDKEKLIPYFPGNTFNEKLDDYYEKEDELSDFYVKVRKRISYFISFWYNGAIINKDDFVKLEKQIDSEES